MGGCEEGGKEKEGELWLYIKCKILNKKITKKLKTNLCVCPLKFTLLIF